MHAYVIFLAAVCASVNADTRAKPQMYSNITYALENEDFNMFCVTQADATIWRVDNADNPTFAFIQYYNNLCTANNYIINNTTSFAYSCHDESNAVRYTLTLKNVHVSQNKQRWFCSYFGANTSELEVNVSALVKNVTVESGGQVISSTLTFQENDVKKIACTSSFSIPRANVTWYVTERANTDKIVLTAYNLTHTWQGQIVDFESTTSTLLVNFNRTYNGWVLVCEAENIHGYAAVSKNVLLNITYPTNKPILHCTNNGIFKVIQNTKGNLTCSVDEGNPAGTLHWNCTGSVTYDQVQHNKVTHTVVWDATQTQYCTCYSTNIAGTSSTSVMAEVLYPPVIHALRNKTVFEGESVTLQCDVVRANPSVNRIQWTYTKHSVSESTLLIPNVSRSDDMVYTCIANNSMNPSCQDVVKGSTSKSLHVEVLYPPYVNILRGKTFTVQEGGMFSYACPVVPGNPPSTNITWRRSNDTKTWSSAHLLIHNITRYDDSVYTCYASNVMVNSNGTIKKGNMNADIRLNVKFKTIVIDFYMRGYGHDASIMVMENTSLVFECRLQSNPIADVRIYKTGSLVNSSKANALSHYTTASCSGGPVSYSCHGNNSLNNKPSTRLIHLFVYCIPRQDMNGNVQFNVTSVINQTVTLSYTALAFPHPSFVWYRNGSSIKTRDSRFNISSTELQTNLTITNVEDSDFGEYTLIVSNDIGSINESFHLKPDGVPEVPTHLTQDASSTTSSVIALNWRSGFKNGSEQFFIVLYNKQTEDNWQSVNVQDTGPTGTTIHYNITGLSSGTSYHIVLFAVNAKGRSTPNATLTCITKPTDDPTDHSPIIGVAAGSAAGLLLIGVVIAGVVIVRRRIINSSKTNEQPECSTIETPIPATYENLKNDQLPNESLDYQRGTANNRTSETNVDHTYEGLSREDSGKENKYTHLGNDSIDDPKPTYENLKI